MAETNPADLAFRILRLEQQLESYQRLHAEELEEIRGKLNPLITKKCPFKIEPKTNTPVVWVRPELVCEVAFHGWTKDGLMRQPVFLRLRDDKTAREVVREKPQLPG